MALPKKTYVCIEKKQLSEDQEDELVSLFVGELAFLRTSHSKGLHSYSGLSQRHQGDNSSRCWHVQGLEDTNLVLSFKLAGVPGFWKQRSSLVGPQFRWERWLKHHFLVTSFEFQLAQAILENVA